MIHSTRLRTRAPAKDLNPQAKHARSAKLRHSRPSSAGIHLPLRHARTRVGARPFCEGPGCTLGALLTLESPYSCLTPNPESDHIEIGKIGVGLLDRCPGEAEERDPSPLPSPLSSSRRPSPNENLLIRPPLAFERRRCNSSAKSC